MKRGTASRVFFGVDKTNEDFGGLLLLSQVTLGKKSGMFDEHKGLCIVDNVLLGKGIARVISVIIRGTSPLSLPDAVADSLSYVKAFGGTEQRNLPDGYIERQFIYMMDDSYLLPNITPEADWHIEMDFQTTSVSTQVRNYFGSRYVDAPTGAGIRLAHTGSGYLVLYGFDTTNPYTGNSYKMQSNTRYKYIYNNNSASLSTGGTVVSSTTFTVDDTTTREVAINNYSSSDTWGTATEGIYLYSFKAWNGQGELVMDLVPAVQKGTVPVVGFYDTVSETFKTATAGTFAAGGEAVPTPTTPIDIVSNNGVLKASRNLLDKSEFAKHLHWQIITSRNEIQYDETFNWGVSDWIKVTPGQAYTFSTQSNRSGAALFLTDEYGKTTGLVVSGIVPTTAGQTNTYTIPEGYNYIVIQTNPTYFDVDVQIEKGSTATPYTPYSPTGIYTDGTVETIEDTIGNTATVEMLLKVGDYQDVQSIIDGVVTRNVGVKVLDGTENWVEYGSSIPGLVYSDNVITNNLIGAPVTSMICSHLQIDKTTTVEEGRIRFQGNVTTNNVTSGRVYIKADSSWTLAQTTQWLADQYAAGTPVIVIYPLATPTTESVAGQTLQVTDGDNVLEITQASLNGLELEAQYLAAVSLTIQEVEDANLDPNVEVTIN